MILPLFNDEVTEDSIVNKNFANNIIPFNFDKSFEFIENTLCDFGFCSDMFSAIVAYAEYAIREKDIGNDDEAGFLMGAALTMAHLYSFTSFGQDYLSDAKKENFDEEALIVHCALKLVEELFKGLPYEEEYHHYQNALDTAVSNYIRLKDANEE